MAFKQHLKTIQQTDSTTSKLYNIAYAKVHRCNGFVYGLAPENGICDTYSLSTYHKSYYKINEFHKENDVQSCKKNAQIRNN